MKSISTYRHIALSLAAVFALFNIGLPIVVASCPMMEMTQGVACCAMNDGGSGGVARISNAVDTSCCQTKFAADRNKTAFLQEQSKRIETTNPIIASLQFEISQSTIRNPQSSTTLASSPPRCVDIPILVSSLLI